MTILHQSNRRVSQNSIGNLEFCSGRSTAIFDIEFFNLISRFIEIIDNISKRLQRRIQIYKPLGKTGLEGFIYLMIIVL